jgi:hypothetical protein
MDNEKNKLSKFHEHLNDRTRIWYFQGMGV